MLRSLLAKVVVGSAFLLELDDKILLGAIPVTCCVDGRHPSALPVGFNRIGHRRLGPDLDLVPNSSCVHVGDVLGDERTSRGMLDLFGES